MRQGLIACLMVTWLLTVAMHAGAEPTAKELAQLQAQMSKLQARLDQELAERDQVLASLSSTQLAISSTQKAIDHASEQKKTLEATLKTLSTRQQRLDAESQQALVALTDLLIKGYPVSEQSALKALLNQTSPGDAARLMAYHRILSTQTVAQLNKLSRQIAAAVKAKSEINEKLAALERLESAQAKRLTAMADLEAQRQIDLDKLNKRIQTDAERLERLRVDEQRLAEVLATANEAAPTAVMDADLPPISELKGQLPMPVAGSAVKRFGQTRQSNARWQGWLIETPSEATVHAVAPGRVVYADWLRGYGLLVIIDHQRELLSLYAHNERLFFEVGDWVRMGDQIAVASRPGRDPLPDSAGIYFELRQQGQPTDPAAWINTNRMPNRP